VEKEVKIGCRFYTKGSDYPSLLYFHGNGEIVDDYDECSRFYNEIGINLFVADYRGYGFSDGTPTMTNLVRDAHKIFRSFCESGPANNLRQYIRHLVPSDHPIWNDDFSLLNKVRLRSISTPTLIIHGEYDTGVPLKEGKELYENSAAKNKKLVIVPNADHNDLMIVGKKQYFEAIEEFVRKHV